MLWVKMVGAASMAGLAVDSHMCPCLCVDTLSVSNLSFKSSGDLGLYRNSMGRKQSRHSTASLALSSSFVDTWHDWRLSGKILTGIIRLRPRRKLPSLVIFNEVAGQYDDTFEDVTKQIVNYFTYKATRTVLNQLYEMNPPQYRWLYNFIVTNNPAEGKRFIRTLAKEKHELAERVMITRLHLYSKWVKKCDHAKIYQQISDQNLELMRERLMETVVWPSDDTNTGKIG